MRMRAVLGTVLCMAAGPAVAQYDSQPHWVVPAGGTLTIYRVVNVNPDCSSLGPSTIHLLQPPQGGQVTTGQRPDYVAFPPNNPRAVCNRRKLPATELFYHAARDFTGFDRFSAEVISPIGVATTRNFTVEVR